MTTTTSKQVVVPRLRFSHHKDVLTGTLKATSALVYAWFYMSCWIADSIVSRLTCWLAGWLVDWLVGWVVDWFVWLVNWFLVGRQVFEWLDSWLTGLLAGWLVD